MWVIRLLFFLFTLYECDPCVSQCICAGCITFTWLTTIVSSNRISMIKAGGLPADFTPCWSQRGVHYGTSHRVKPTREHHTEWSVLRNITQSEAYHGTSHRVKRTMEHYTEWRILFEIKLESCVLLLADYLRTKVKGHRQQAVVTSNVCSLKSSCSGNVYSWSETLPH